MQKKVYTKLFITKNNTIELGELEIASLFQHEVDDNKWTITNELTGEEIKQKFKTKQEAVDALLEDIGFKYLEE